MHMDISPEKRSEIIYSLSKAEEDHPPSTEIHSTLGRYSRESGNPASSYVLVIKEELIGAEISIVAEVRRMYTVSGGGWHRCRCWE